MRRLLAGVVATLAAATAVAVPVATSGPAQAGRAWVGANKTFSLCISTDCGAYAAALHWDISWPGHTATGYYVFLNGTQAADVSRSPWAIDGGDCGTVVTLGVEAHDGSGNTSQLYTSNYTTPSCGSGPTLTAEPVVTGTVASGSTLSTTHGTWTGTPTSYSYQWKDCAGDGSGCVNITGATSSAYAVQAGDAGHTIQAAVTATNASGSGTAGAPLVPIVDEFGGSSVDTNIWNVIGQVGDTGHTEPQCYLPAQVAEGSGNLTETYGFSAGGNTCPPAAGSGDPIGTLSGSLTTGAAVTSIPITGVNTAYHPIAGSLTVSDGTNTDTFTATGPLSGGSIPVTSHAPTHSYASGATVNPTLSQTFVSGDVQETATAFTYGTIVVRAELPANPRTTWPAIWLLGAACQSPNHLSSNCSWPSDTSDAAEIDIAEGITGNQTTVGENTYSNSLSNGCTSGTISNYATNFHTYELDWSAGSLVFKIDGVTQTACDVSGANVPSHPMFLVINSAVENTAGITSADLPAATTVDYVHVSH